MNLERLRWGEWIAAIAALNLLLVTFRSWYKVTGTDAHVTAWDALDTGRYLLLATAAVGIFLWLYQAAEDRGRLEIPIGWVAAAIGLACTIYIAYRLASPPSDALDPDIGLYLGLVSALGVTIGGLLSAREPETYTSSYATPDETAAPIGEPEPAGADTWSPAAPAASTTGWSPAAPAAPVPPATPAGAVGAGDAPLQAGDAVVLTAGGARFAAGTVAHVVESFPGGALVEVTAPDGMAERFEVPDSAYERAPASGAAGGGETWSPAMPAAAGDDWGFDESAAPAAAGAGAGAATGLGEREAEQPKKTPWWKREIGGGKKKQDDDEGLGVAGAVAAGAAGAAAVDADSNGAGGEKPGFFKRIFGGGGSKDEPDTAALEGESTPASDVAGVGQAAESDTAVAETAVDEPPAAVSEPAPPVAPEPEPLAMEPDAAPDPAPAPAAPDPAPAAASEPEVAPAEPDIEPIASEAEPEPDVAPAEPEVAPAASEPEPSTPEPEPPASAPEPEAAAPEPQPEPPAAEHEAAPEPEASAPDVSASEAAAGLGAAGAGAGAAAAAAAASAGDEVEKPKRKRSSGSRKVPQEAVAAAAGGDAQPKVGDQVKLKVGGGKYDAGTQGTVVDVFSAGVIVELSDAEGRTERLDLPFEAIGPADA